MARRLSLFVLTIVLSVVGTSLPSPQRVALAAELDEKGEAEAKEALRLYKQGLYDEAAKIFAKLSVDHPDMLIFERNLGACFYYLRKPEPALSNLRHYLSHKQDIAPDDKAVVERWINEMEGLRAQNAMPIVPPAPQPVPALPLVPAPTPVSATLEASSATKPPQVSPLSPIGAEKALSSAQSAVPIAATAPETNQPAAIDLTASPAPSHSTNADSPFYAKWWFWTAVGVVAAGSVSAYVLATHHWTDNACAGGTLPCDAIK